MRMAVPRVWMFLMKKRNEYDLFKSNQNQNKKLFKGSICEADSYLDATIFSDVWGEFAF